MNFMAQSTHMPMPPLLGDGNGRYRVKVTGNSGSGKSTLSKALANLLNVPYISLDRLFWRPGWQESPLDEFRANISKALDSSEGGWVVDGSYSGRIGGIVDERATDIIWLDPPLVLYFPRIFIRTLLRLFGIGLPCSPGCHESVRSVFFSKDSVLWWCLTHHSSFRKKHESLMREGGVDGKLRRLCGWGTETKIWWKDVEKMVRAKN